MVRNRTSHRWVYTYTPISGGKKCITLFGGRNPAVPHILPGQRRCQAVEHIHGFALPLSSTPAFYKLKTTTTARYNKPNNNTAVAISSNQIFISNLYIKNYIIYYYKHW